MYKHQVREAKATDAELITALINEAYAPAESFLYDGPRIGVASVREKLGKGVFLLESGSDNLVRGCVNVEITGDKGYFGLLAVWIPHQGCGIARALISAAEAYALARGCRTMEIDVVNHRRELFGFYAAAGYVVTGERTLTREAALKISAYLIVMQKALA